MSTKRIIGIIRIAIIFLGYFGDQQHARNCLAKLLDVCETQLTIIRSIHFPQCNRTFDFAQRNDKFFISTFMMAKNKFPFKQIYQENMMFKSRGNVEAIIKGGIDFPSVYDYMI